MAPSAKHLWTIVRGLIVHMPRRCGVPTRPAHPYLKALGGRIRDLREKRGLSQEALALEADVDRSYMSGLERGRRNPGVLQLLKIARALKIPPSALFPRTGH